MQAWFKKCINASCNVNDKDFADKDKIVDVEVKNVDQNHISTVNKLPRYNYYKQILTHNLFEFTKDRNHLSCPDLPDLQIPPKCKAISLCFCGILGNVTSGTYKLEYKTKIEGIPEKQGIEAHNDDVTYKFNVK